MREIKFRGLRTDGKGWVYGDLIQTTNGYSYIFNGDVDDIHTCWMNLVELKTVGQYTGMKDKDGVEIFEGDILHFQTYQGGGFIQSGIDCYAQVVYGDHNFTDTLLNRSIGFYLLTGKNHRETSIGYWLYSHKSTVIGNIHQNPELL